jgi:hypothetical protein
MSNRGERFYCLAEPGTVIGIRKQAQRAESLGLVPFVWHCAQGVIGDRKQAQRAESFGFVPFVSHCAQGAIGCRKQAQRAES